MIRLNFTGRKRIARSHMQLALRVEGGVPVLDLSALSLPRDLPAEAEVIVEAYERTTVSRISAGTVGSLDLPIGHPLPEFGVPDLVKVRVKVVGTGDEGGLLLAQADRLRPSLEHGSVPTRSMIPARPDDGMGQTMWRVSVEDEAPILLVNSAIDDWRGFTVSPAFQTLVLPEVLRRCLEWVDVTLAIEGEPEETDSDLALWVTFARQLGQDPLEWQGMDEVERAEAITEAVAAFARSKRLLDQFLSTVEDQD